MAKSKAAGTPSPGGERVPRRRDQNGIRLEPSTRDRFAFPAAPGAVRGFYRSHSDATSDSVAQLCRLLGKAAEDLLARRCGGRHFVVESIFKPCEGKGQAGAPGAVDLVVLIDTSGSMQDEAAALSAQADAAIATAAAACPSDLRVGWFGLEGTFVGTKFTTTFRDYLHGIGVADADIDHRVGGVGQEDGGAAIKDACEHYDWRLGAGRAILFLGDEPLDAGSPQNADDVASANRAISAAQAASTRVYTYAGTGIESFIDSATGVRAQDEFARVAHETNGVAYSAIAGDLGDFGQILREVICSAGQGQCRTARMPEIRPCFELRWGDGPTDHIETDDVEVLCLTASNPYTNLSFADVTAFVVVVGPNGLPATLPDGTPSVFIKPDMMICFGKIGPCSSTADPPANSVSREVVLVNRGAQEGRYYVLVVYCYEVALHLAYGSIFPLDLVKS